jgi:hypothetical protein
MEEEGCQGLSPRGSGKRRDAEKEKRMGIAQYDFGSPSTFSAMKHMMSCGLMGAMRGIMISRR